MTVAPDALAYWRPAMPMAVLPPYMKEVRRLFDRLIRTGRLDLLMQTLTLRCH